MEVIKVGGQRSESKKYDNYESFLSHISSSFTITQPVWQPGRRDELTEENYHNFDQIQKDISHLHLFVN